MSVRSFRRFIGINLGGGRGKTTAVARLERTSEDFAQPLLVKEARLRYNHRGSGEEQGPSEDGSLFHDEMLVAYLKRWLNEDTVVAINAPLTLPACVRCQLACPGISACTVPVVRWMRTHEPRLTNRRKRQVAKLSTFTPYTQRAVDILYNHVELRPRETLGQGMGPVTARAIYLRRALSPLLRLHENLLEVHPPATLIRLFGPNMEQQLRNMILEDVWESRKRLLQHLPVTLQFHYVWPEIVAKNPHIFDALICAFTAFLWAKEGWKGPDDLLRSEDSSLTERPLVKDPLPVAVVDLDQLWMEDGWIWVPPDKSSKTPPRHLKG